MALRYLLDTNTASYIIKGNMPAVRDNLLKVAANYAERGGYYRSQLRAL